jgi:hypothetical protein
MDKSKSELETTYDGSSTEIVSESESESDNEQDVFCPILYSSLNSIKNFQNLKQKRYFDNNNDNDPESKIELTSGLMSESKTKPVLESDFNSNTNSETKTMLESKSDFNSNTETKITNPECTSINTHRYFPYYCLNCFEQNKLQLPCTSFKPCKKCNYVSGYVETCLLDNTHKYYKVHGRELKCPVCSFITKNLEKYTGVKVMTTNEYSNMTTHNYDHNYNYKRPKYFNYDENLDLNKIKYSNREQYDKITNVNNKIIDDCKRKIVNKDDHKYDHKYDHKIKDNKYDHKYDHKIKDNKYDHKYDHKIKIIDDKYDHKIKDHKIKITDDKIKTDSKNNPKDNETVSSHDYKNTYEYKSLNKKTASELYKIEADLDYHYKIKKMEYELLNKMINNYL